MKSLTISRLEQLLDYGLLGQCDDCKEYIHYGLATMFQPCPHCGSTKHRPVKKNAP